MREYTPERLRHLTLLAEKISYCLVRVQRNHPLGGAAPFAQGHRAFYERPARRA